MSARITPEEIVRMIQLYQEYPNYAEVARRMKRSAKSVAKYIKLEGTPKVVRHTLNEVLR